MAEAAKKVEQMPNTRTDHQIFLKGKLDQVEVVGANKDLFRNIIITPAKDEYSHPQRWCVMAHFAAPQNKKGSNLIWLKPLLFLW